MVEEINTKHLQKTAHPNLPPFPRYSSTKFRFLWENGQNGVQRSLYISRTVIATENLIRYSESTENFLSWRSHQIFAYLSSSGWKSGSKIGNFPKFSKILQNFAFFEKKNFFFKVSKWSNSQKSAIKIFFAFLTL